MGCRWPVGRDFETPGLVSYQSVDWPLGSRHGCGWVTRLVCKLVFGVHSHDARRVGTNRRTGTIPLVKDSPSALGGCRRWSPSRDLGLRGSPSTGSPRIFDLIKKPGLHLKQAFSQQSISFTWITFLLSIFYFWFFSCWSLLIQKSTKHCWI